MKQRKIFLGIAIPRDVSKRLNRIMEQWQHLPIRFVKEKNMHVALLFLGHVLDESVANICQQVQEVCRTKTAFDIEMKQVLFVPEAGLDAREIWFVGDAHDELKHLRESLEKELRMFSAEKKVFQPHIALGRVRKQLWQQQTTFPEKAEDFSVFLPIESVIVYESTFQKGDGLVYEVLAECPLAYS